MKYLLLVASLLTFTCSAYSQETTVSEKPTDQPAENIFDLSSEPPTRDQILATLAEQTKAADAKLSEAQVAHTEAIEAAEASAIAQLKQAAKIQAAKGEIVLATEAWTEVLKLRATDEDARKFLATINRTDIVRKHIAEASQKSSPARQKARVEFQCENGRVFKRLPNGTWADNHAKGVWMHQEVFRNDSYVLLRMADGVEHALLQDMILYRSAAERKGGSVWHQGEPGSWTR